MLINNSIKKKPVRLGDCPGTDKECNGYCIPNNMICCPDEDYDLDCQKPENKNNNACLCFNYDYGEDILYKVGDEVFAICPNQVIHKDGVRVERDNFIVEPPVGSRILIKNGKPDVRCSLDVQLFRDKCDDKEFNRRKQYCFNNQILDCPNVNGETNFCGPYCYDPENFFCVNGKIIKKNKKL